MAIDKRTGNARKKQATYSDGPWVKWPETNPAERAIKFMSTYIRLPKGYGAGELIKLSPEQEEWFSEILGPGVTSAVKSCPRGQGKSTEFAALAVWATFDVSASGAPQVPIIATKVNQAVRGIYGPATHMIKAEPALDERCVIYTAVNNTSVQVASTGGEMFPLANNIDGLQGLDPSLAIVDEIGFQSEEVWNSVVLASGKRPTSLVVGFGTPGRDTDNALYAIRSRHLEHGTIPGFVYKEHAAERNCDHTDEANWYVANPALAAGYQNIEALRTAVKTMPESEFRIFHLGQWVDGTESWLGKDGASVWGALEDPYELEPGVPTWIGLDIGIKRDTTAMVLMQRRPDGRVHADARIWTPTNEQEVNVSEIMHEIRKAHDTYRLVEVAYDPHRFDVAAQMLESEGIPMTEMPQGIDRMAPAFGNLLEAIKRKELRHNGDVAFATQVLNGQPHYNERGFTLKKLKAKGKIDAAYALAMCYDRIQHARPPKARLIAL